MSIITAFQSASAAKIINAEATESISLHIPVRTTCTYCGGPQSYFGGAFDPSCPNCDQGYTIQWQISYVIGRVMWIDPATPRWTRDGIVMTGEVGDVDIQVPMQYYSLLDAARLSMDSYIMVDGKRLKIKSVTQNRIERPTSIDVRCYVVKDEQ